MGALAHYLEALGLATTQISLIAEHTEAIHPPRALWVPFELGRPLGPPDYPDFQREVTLAALRLLEVEGPILEHFPREAPETSQANEEEASTWACPVSFSSPSEEGEEDLATALRREATELRPWYDLRLEQQGRTAMVSFDPQGAVGLIEQYLTTPLPQEPHGELSPAVALRLAAQDLKIFYFEAVTAKPGARILNSRDFSHWFWHRTSAGKALKAIKTNCEESQDQELQTTAKRFLVPMIQ